MGKEPFTSTLVVQQATESVTTQLAPQLGTFYVELLKHLIGEFDGQIAVNSVAVMQCPADLNPQSLSLCLTLTWIFCHYKAV